MNNTFMEADAAHELSDFAAYVYQQAEAAREELDAA